MNFRTFRDLEEKGGKKGVDRRERIWYSNEAPEGEILRGRFFSPKKRGWEHRKGVDKGSGWCYTVKVAAGDLEREETAEAVEKQRKGLTSSNGYGMI